ncbi:hypothetical protein [Oerskovia turbata]
MSPTPQLAVDLSSPLAGGPGWAAGVTAETTPPPSPGGELRPGLEPTDVSPGLPGFLTMFAIAVACVVLFLSLNKQLRKVRHSERSAVGAGAAGGGASSGDAHTGSPDVGPSDGRGSHDSSSDRTSGGSNDFGHDSGSGHGSGDSGGDSGGGGD